VRECPGVPEDKSILVCPADGRVVDIQHVLDNSLEGYAQKVSIFLSVFDVHVNWVPMTGIVEKITYTPGAFKLAFFTQKFTLERT